MNNRPAAMTINLRPLTIDDYDAVVGLWQAIEGIGLSRADERDRIAVYLERNPRMSFVACSKDGELVGAVLCGHDGRRGCLHHLAVRQDARGQGVGRALVERCMEALKGAGIDKCHLFVFHDNQGGRDFWKSVGWYERSELVLMSRDLEWRGR